jgi:hypothetical protein
MKHILIVAFLFTILESNGQPPVAKEWRNLHDRIFRQLHFNDSMDTEDHKAEYILCIFKVDSAGKINDVHYLSDPKNIGSLYKAISSIPTSVFDGWVCQKAMGRTIILPIVYCPEGGCPEYINDLINSRGDKSVYFKVLNETSSTILLTPLRGSKPMIKY